jgi:hypothetical protein
LFIWGQNACFAHQIKTSPHPEALTFLVKFLAVRKRAAPASASVDEPQVKEVAWSLNEVVFIHEANSADSGIVKIVSCSISYNHFNFNLLK